MLKVKICDILPKRKKYAPNFLNVVKYITMYQKINKKNVKMLGKNLVIFALDLKLDWATVTLVLTSAQKIPWLVVWFGKLF